jgi:hypothetical protein
MFFWRGWLRNGTARTALLLVAERSPVLRLAAAGGPGPRPGPRGASRLRAAADPARETTDPTTPARG